MKHNGHVKGTRRASDTVQMTVTFDNRTFNRLATLAKTSELSVTQTVRAVVKRGLAPNLKRVA